VLVALSCGPSRHNKRRQSLAIIAWRRIVRKSQPSRFGNVAPREPRRCVEGGDIPSYQSRESVAGASSFALDHDACGITIKGVRSDTVLAKQVLPHVAVTSGFGSATRGHGTSDILRTLARTLPEGDPRYATDFLPRMDGAGCSPGGGGASGSWWPWPRLCQELRTQELAAVLWPTWRRFDPSSSPSARPVDSAFSPSDLVGK
jgi:hypothetical protein